MLTIVESFHLNTNGRFYISQSRPFTFKDCYDFITVRCLHIRENHLIDGTSFHTLYSLIEDKANLFYNYNMGDYIYLVGDETRFKYCESITTKGCGKFPYRTIIREYSSFNNLKHFATVMHSIQPVETAITQQFPFTFGLEYETARGYLPEKECYKNGLIPLRDGSISAVEYATIVLNAKQGFTLIKSQLAALRKYTEFDLNCSLHVHIGQVPNSLRFAYIMYQVGYLVQNTLLQIMPEYTFHTSMYKQTGKDYCKLLPEIDNWDEFFNFVTTGNPMYDEYHLTLQNYQTDMPHPANVTGDAKWHIQSRYYWLNLVNLLFYNKAKTVEFRFLRPTVNYNVIVNWLYVLGAIVQYAKKIYQELHLTDLNQLPTQCANMLSHVDLCKILSDVYPTNMSQYLIAFLQTVQRVTHIQARLHDHIGYLNQVEEAIITTNVLNCDESQTN